MKSNTSVFIIWCVVAAIMAGCANPMETFIPKEPELVQAAKHGKLSKVRRLLSSGASINASTTLGHTALMLAAMNGHTDVVRVLLDQGADAWARAADGQTAIDLAQANGHSEIVKLLGERQSQTTTMMGWGPSQPLSGPTVAVENAVLKDEREAMLVVQESHTLEITVAAISPNGRILATGGVDSSILLWDFTSGKLLSVLRGHTKRIRALAFSPDGAFLASGAEDGSLKIWKTPAGELVQTLPWPDSVLNIVFSPSAPLLAVSGGMLSEEVSLIRTTDWQEITKLKNSGSQHSRPAVQIRYITGLAFSPDGKTLAVSQRAHIPDTKTATLIDASALYLFDVVMHKPITEVAVMPESVRPISAIAFNHQGDLLAIGAEDSTITIWHTKKRIALQTVRSGQGPIDSIAFSPDDRLIATAGRDGTAKLWRLTDVDLVRTIGEAKALQISGMASSGANKSNSIAFTPNGQYLIMTGRDTTAAVWEVGSGERSQSFGSGIGIASLAVSPDGTKLAIGRTDNSLSVVDLVTGKILFADLSHILRDGMSLRPQPFGKRYRGVTSLAFNDDGTLLAAGSTDGTIKLWTLPNYRLVRTITVGRPVLNIAMAGNKLASGSCDMVGRVWDVENGKVVLSVVRDDETGEYRLLTGREVIEDARPPIDANSNPPCREILVAFGGDHHNLFTLTPGGLRQWSLQTFRLSHSFPVPTPSPFSGDLASLAVSKNGQLVAAGTTDWATGTIIVWDRNSGEKLWMFDAHVGEVSALQFSTDDSVLISAGADNNAFFWLRGGLRLLGLIGHRAPITALASTPDKNLVMTGSEDGSVKIWNPHTGKELVSILLIGQELILKTSENYYMTSRAGLSAVGFRKGNNFYPFEQFDLKFNRPDMVLRQLGIASDEQISSYRLAYQKRLKKMGLKEEHIGTDLHVPTVHFLSTDVPLSTDMRAVPLRVKASDDKYQLDRLNVFVNDVPIYGVAGIPLREKQARVHEQEIQIPLASGKNKIQVSVLNEQGAESLRETISVTSTSEPPPQNTYLLAIGVSKYRNPVYNLVYAAKDANDLTQAFVAAQTADRTVGHLQARLLTDEQATRANIRAAKEWLKRATIDDRVIVFVAGHGLTDQHLNYYFGTHDVDMNNPAKDGLPYEELDHLLDGLPALRKLLLIDTCFSGEIDKTETSWVAAAGVEAGQTDEQVKVRAFSSTRGVQLHSGLTTSQSQKPSPDDSPVQRRLDTAMVKFQEDWFADLRRGTGAAVISSSSGDEYSLESDKWQNGVFTYAVLKGLKERAADRNNDRHITVSELQSYVIEQVKRLTNGGQNPTVRQENLENDFVVY